MIAVSLGDLKSSFFGKNMYVFLSRKVFDGAIQTDYCEIGVKENFTATTFGGPQFLAAIVNNFTIDGAIYSGAERASYEFSLEEIEEQNEGVKIKGTIGTPLQHPLVCDEFEDYSGKKLEGVICSLIEGTPRTSYI